MSIRRWLLRFFDPSMRWAEKGRKEVEAAERDGYERVTLFLPPMPQDSSRSDIMEAGAKLRTALGVRYHDRATIDWNRSNMRTGEYTVLVKPEAQTCSEADRLKPGEAFQA